MRTEWESTAILTRGTECISVLAAITNSYDIFNCKIRKSITQSYPDRYAYHSGCSEQNLLPLHLLPLRLEGSYPNTNNGNKTQG